MRLWHQKLLGDIPMNQLKSQHRECCALRGQGWGRKHSTVDYVFTHPIEKLVAYHVLVMNEINTRNPSNNLNRQWFNPQYRGKVIHSQSGLDKHINPFKHMTYLTDGDSLIYSEHNEAYYQYCLMNLRGKLQPKLHKTVDKYGLSSDKVLEVSQELDRIISLLMGLMEKINNG